uniref:Calponin-homology (CH) domain-containing protein n=1 Tax=Rhinolophus ferrumequinum TaxID=59479 RepID=A0A671F0L7_RHIFE
MALFNKSPSYGSSAEVKNKIASKYDHQSEDLCHWIEEVTDVSTIIKFQLGLEDCIILCKLINKLQPGSLKKVNESLLTWPQLENIGNFSKAIQAHGMKLHNMFEANDLFENKNGWLVQTMLMAIVGLAKTKEKQTRYLDEGLLKAGQSVIGLQMGVNKCASQAGMIAYGTRRHLYDSKIDIYNQNLTLQSVDNLTISLQMSTNKITSQKGMSVFGLRQQVYDPKYCAAPTEPVIHNGSQGIGTNGLKSVIALIRQNTQMNIMMSTKMTTPDVTNMVTKWCGVLALGDVPECTLWIAERWIAASK